MKNLAKNDITKKLERNFWTQFKFNQQETCKEMLEDLVQKKKLFHLTREYVYCNAKNILTVSPTVNTKAWRESINSFQEKLKKLSSEITVCEMKLKERLWLADFSLSNIIDERKLHENKSKSTVALLNDLNTLKQSVSELKTHTKITPHYTHFEYPVTNKRGEIDYAKKNEGIFKRIQEKIAKDKKRDYEINQTLATHYQKVVDSSKNVMKHNQYIYSQSWHTALVNVVGLLSGVGIVAGLWSKSMGSHFFVWEQTPTIDLQPKEWQTLRKSTELLGISKKR